VIEKIEEDDSTEEEHTEFYQSLLEDVPQISGGGLHVFERRRRIESECFFNDGGLILSVTRCAALCLWHMLRRSVRSHRS